MAEVDVGELPEGTKRCIACGEPIRMIAKRCIHCTSDQDPVRQRLGFSTNLMSMSVALISVLGVVVPILIESATRDDSHLIFSLQHATEVELFVIVSNQGREPGTVSVGTLQVKGGKSVQIRSSERSPVEIIDPKKSTLLHFHKFVFDGKRVTADFNFDAPKDQPCILSIHVTSFRGERSTLAVERPCGDFAPFVKPI
ncbi:MAG: hypothetical protein E6G95_21850 [Alphaproteobacteria bacterium]|nr:MAG: hypothetical protein E6G95_21850 [Alphaproteobacteria bacterium]